MIRQAIGAVAFLLFSQVAHAWFKVDMACNVTPGQATCAIQNTGSIPMFCDLRADGRLASGQFIYAYLNDWVPPGQYRYVYVYTSPPHPPLVGAFGGGQCRF